MRTSTGFARGRARHVAARSPEGHSAALRLTGRDVLAVAYLAVAVTAVAFVLWYSSVRRLGAALRACSPAWLPSPPRPLVSPWAQQPHAPPSGFGIAVVASGLVLGLSAARRP